MAYILVFIAGCLFSLVLVAICLLVSYKVIDFKENIEVRREDKQRKIRRNNTPIPDGGVIRPKTYEELENDKNEELQAFNEILNSPGTE